MTVGRSLALAAYPPSFRERYGEELAALSEDHGRSRRATADLAVGAARAWVRPTFARSPAEVRRLRPLSSISTVWVCWCVVVVGTMATLRLLEDPAAPGLDVQTPGWVLAGHLTTAAIAIAAVLITAAGAAPGWRAMRSSAVVRRLMIGPLAVLVLVVVGFVPIALVAIRTPAVNHTKQFSPLFAVGLLVWTLVVAITAIWWTIAIPRALRAARPKLNALRVPWRSCSRGGRSASGPRRANDISRDRDGNRLGIRRDGHLHVVHPRRHRGCGGRCRQRRAKPDRAELALDAVLVDASARREALGACRRALGCGQARQYGGSRLRVTQPEPTDVHGVRVTRRHHVPQQCPDRSDATHFKHLLHR